MENTDSMKTNPTHIWYMRKTAAHFGKLDSRPSVRIVRPSGKRWSPVRYTDINHLWHTPNESPSAKVPLLIMLKSGMTVCLLYNGSDFRETCKNKGWVRWAYVNSFLPYK